jgi:hypothetical protein
MRNFFLFRARGSQSLRAAFIVWLLTVHRVSATAAVLFCGDTDADGLVEAKEIQDCIDSFA